MPQAVAAIAPFFTAIGFSAAASTFLAKVFVYVAVQYLLNRAALALTPSRRSNGLGGGNAANYYDAGAVTP